MAEIGRFEWLEAFDQVFEGAAWTLACRCELVAHRSDILIDDLSWRLAQCVRQAARRWPPWGLDGCAKARAQAVMGHRRESATMKLGS